jgi:hypothetical protein
MSDGPLAGCAQREHNCTLHEHKNGSPACHVPCPPSVGGLPPSPALLAAATPERGLPSSRDRAPDRRSLGSRQPRAPPLSRGRAGHAARRRQPSAVPGGSRMRRVRGACGPAAEDHRDGRHPARCARASFEQDRPRLCLRLGRPGQGGPLQRCGRDDSGHGVLRGCGRRDPAAADHARAPDQSRHPEPRRFHREEHRARWVSEPRACRTESPADGIAR